MYLNLFLQLGAFLFLYFLLQYQNVFAPLIKLEADYDKVCMVVLYLFFLSPFIGLLKGWLSCRVPGW